MGGKFEDFLCCFCPAVLSKISNHLQIAAGAAFIESGTVAPSATTANGSDTAKSSGIAEPQAGNTTPPPPPMQSAPAPPTQDSPLSVAAIVGIIFGILSAIGLIGGGVTWYRRSNRYRAEVGENQEVSNPGGVFMMGGVFNNHGNIGDANNTARMGNSNNDVLINMAP